MSRIERVTEEQFRRRIAQGQMRRRRRDRQREEACRPDTSAPYFLDAIEVAEPLPDQKEGQR